MGAYKVVKRLASMGSKNNGHPVTNNQLKGQGVSILSRNEPCGGGEEKAPVLKKWKNHHGKTVFDMNSAWD